MFSSSQSKLVCVAEAERGLGVFVFVFFPPRKGEFYILPHDLIILTIYLLGNKW
jgi:hypothetical protein